jgi:mannose-1-phosphate guanylyltransferase
MLHAVIMAGGGGTRFWPRSRQARPKQFLALAGDRTLLQATCDRLEAQVPPSKTWVITTDTHREEALRQLPHIPTPQIIGEPTGRDTAPCVALAAALIARDDPDAVLLIKPADHVIDPVQEFRRMLHAVEQLAVEHPESLITFGIPATWPSTGYGYIRRGAASGTRQGIPVHRVESFREKPDQTTALEYVQSGAYYWNAGIFAGRATAFLRQFAQQKPLILAGVERIAADWNSPRSRATLEKEYPQLEKISFDFAVMEKAPEVLVLEAPYRWDDVGSWLALERLQAQDVHGNTVQGEHCGIDTKDCVVVSEPGKVIATIGVDNLVIVQDGDCILIADRRRESDVKKLVEELRRRGLEHHL